jgi:hypothetical protein
MSATAGAGDPGRPPSEEELRAAYEAQIKQLRVEHILLDTVVALVNLGMRRTGLAPGTEGERDVEQVHMAIESVRALMPQLEPTAPAAEIGQLRSALSQLQLAYVRIGGQAAPAGAAEGQTAAAGAGAERPGGGGPAGDRPRPGGPAAEPPRPGGPAAEPRRPGEPGPAQRSGRLWVPGQ